jgi:hypothetical protein
MVLSLVIFATFRHHLTIADQRSSVSALLDVPLGPEYEDRPDPPEVERQRITALIIMCGIVMMFWMAFHQNGTTLTFWARDNTDRFIRWGSWSYEIPPGVFAAVNSVFIITLTPIVVFIMGRLRRVGLEPSTPAKLGIGMLLTAVAYAVMVLGSLAGGNTGKVSMWWLIGCYFVITIGELHGLADGSVDGDQACAAPDDGDADGLLVHLDLDWQQAVGADWRVLERVVPFPVFHPAGLHLTSGGSHPGVAVPAPQSRDAARGSARR